MAEAGFLFPYLIGPLPYVWRHITVYKNVLSVSLNKKIPFLSFTFFFYWGETNKQENKPKLKTNKQNKQTNNQPITPTVAVN